MSLHPTEDVPPAPCLARVETETRRCHSTRPNSCARHQLTPPPLLPPQGQASDQVASSTGRDAAIGAATDAGVQARGSVPTPQGLAPPTRPPRLQPPSTPSQPPSVGAACFGGASCSTASSSTRTASTLESPVLATPVGRPVTAIATVRVRGPSH